MLQDQMRKPSRSLSSLFQLILRLASYAGISAGAKKTGHTRLDEGKQPTSDLTATCSSSMAARVGSNVFRLAIRKPMSAQVIRTEGDPGNIASMKTVQGGPLLFRFAKFLHNNDLRGGSFLIRNLKRLGILDVFATYQLGAIQFGVPLNRLPWDLRDIENYEFPLIRAFCAALEPFHNVTLFDCGADIGSFTAIVCARSVAISRVIAYEPSADVNKFLARNLKALSVPSQLEAKAVSNFEGLGRLQRPDYDTHDHARFLVPGGGDIPVTTIDGANVQGNIAIKIDVEGGELNVIEGAQRTIATAPRCVVAFEAHPNVSRRIGRDPVECLKLLESIRPFNFVVAETGRAPSTLHPLLNSGSTDIWNVVAVSTEG
jgi:FkbM family methyltransferase